MPFETTPLHPLITRLCKKIEKEENVKILFAVENGSRAWRMQSANSDYDVRFVFVRPMKDYFYLKQKPEVIERYYDSGGKACEAKGCSIDTVGFDVMKYAKLLSKSNPTAIEWLMTDVVYHGKQNPVFKKFAQKDFSRTSLIHHYRSLCMQNYIKYIKSGNLVSYKKYLYAFRGLVNARYVELFDEAPPINFNEAFSKKGIVSDQVKEKLDQIILLKKKGQEKDIASRIPLFDSQIESFLKRAVPREEPSQKHLDILEKEVRKIILRK